MEERRGKLSSAGDAVTSGGGREDPWGRDPPLGGGQPTACKWVFPFCVSGRGQAGLEATVGPVSSLQWSCPPLHPRKEESDTTVPLAVASGPEGLKA